MIDMPDDPSEAFNEGGAARIRAAMPILTKKQAQKLFQEAVSAAETSRNRARADWDEWLKRRDQRRREDKRETREKRPYIGPESVLGVSRDATRDEIVQAWRRLARTAHPDVQGGDTTRMATINAARDAMLKRLGVRP